MPPETPPPMTVNDLLKLTRTRFPNATVLFATNAPTGLGSIVIGDPAFDDPKPLTYAQAVAVGLTVDTRIR